MSQRDATFLGWVEDTVAMFGRAIYLAVYALLGGKVLPPQDYRKSHRRGR